MARSERNSLDLDAAAGYADNEDLATRLLGFPPTRHVPLGWEATV